MKLFILGIIVFVGSVSGGNWLIFQIVNTWLYYPLMLVIVYIMWGGLAMSLVGVLDYLYEVVHNINRSSNTVSNAIS